MTVLAQEILSGTYDPKFPIPSEHQLCRRFGVSRVTVRLALSDLQNRGLIYRHHGKGTFIHGTTKLGGKPLAILMRSPEQAACPSLALFLRGFQSYLSEAETYSVNIGVIPAQWSPSMSSSLGGVLVIPDGVTATDLDNIRKRNLPYLIYGGGDLPGSSIRLGAEAAVYEAVLTLASRDRKRFGFIRSNSSPHENLKEQGIAKALSQAGLGTSALTEIICAPTCLEISRAAERMLDQTPPPDVVLTSEPVHTLAILNAARERKLVIGQDIHIIHFGNQAPDQTMHPDVTLIQLALADGGKKAAEALCRTSLLAQPLESITLPYQIHWATGS